MSKPLADRSGRSYPHNAIYEILTYGVPAGERNEPKKYSKRTINVYWKMMEAAPPKTRQAYELVYANKNTLKEAAMIMHCAPTTVNRYLKLIYFARDKHGYLTSMLEKASHTSYTGQSIDSLALAEKIDRYYHHFMDLRVFTYYQVLDILTADSEKIDAETIAKFYKYDVSDVASLIEDFHYKCR